MLARLLTRHLDLEAGDGRPGLVLALVLGGEALPFLANYLIDGEGMIAFRQLSTFFTSPPPIWCYLKCAPP
jgi:hypothetical protein